MPYLLNTVEPEASFFLTITLNQSYLTIISEDSSMVEESWAVSSYMGTGKYLLKPPQLIENVPVKITHTKYVFI